MEDHTPMASFRKTGFVRTALAIASLAVIALFLPSIWKQHSSENDNQRESARDSVEFLANSCIPVSELYRKGALSLENARAAITSTVRRARAGKDNSVRYFFLLNRQGYYLANGQNTETEGKQKIFFSDPKIIDQRRHIDTNGRGFISYQYYDADKDVIAFRNVYMAYLPDIELYIGTDFSLNTVRNPITGFRNELWILPIAAGVILIMLLFLITSEYLAILRFIHRLAPHVDFSGKISSLIPKFPGTLLVREFRRIIMRVEGQISFSNTLMGTIPSAVLICDLKGRIIVTNMTTDTMFCTNSELRGSSAYSLFVSEFQGKKANDLFSVESSLESVYWEAICEETPFPVFVQRRKIYLEQEPFLLIIVTDLSEMQKANADIVFRSALLENVADSVIAHIPGERILYANGAACRLHQFTLGELEYMNAEELIFPTSLKTYREEISRIKSTKHSEFEVSHRRKNGTFVQMKTYCSSINVNGREMIIETHHDLTDIHSSQHALEESEERFRSFFDNAKDCIFITTSNGYFLNINNYGKSLLGIESDPSEIDLFTLFVNPDECARFRKEISTFGFVRDFRTEFHRIDGSQVSVEINASFFHNPVYHLTGYNGFIRDVTNEITMSAQLLQAQKLDAIGRLAGGIAHDFNNVLTVIIGNTELSLLSIGAENELYEPLCQIKESAERAARLTGQLLAFSRKQANQPDIINPYIIINEFYHMLKRIIGDPIELELRLDPSASSIRADQNQFEQVILNLVLNAHDAIIEKPDRHENRIIIETAHVYIDSSFVQTHKGISRGAYVLISVIDSGVGIPEENLDKIFDPFFTTKSPEKGSGLGLSTVFGIISQNKAFIYALSTPQQNTRFDIYWPCSEETIEAVSDKPREECSSDDSILIVEDEQSLCSFTATALRKKGYTVYSAFTADDALEIASAHPELDLAFIDIVLPIKNGVQVAHEIKHILPKIKIIFTSGFHDSYAQYEETFGEKADFIKKPYSISSLNQIIIKNMKA
jgi:PAS domain S-box-containing protein